MANRVWPLISGGSEPLDPDGMPEVAEPLRWLLERAGDGEGLRLTQGGALNRALVREAAERYPSWWEADIFGPPHREADLGALEELHELCRRAKLLRLRRGKLLLTPAGRSCLADSTALADAAARGLIGEGFHSAVAEPVLATLLLHGDAESVSLAAAAHPIVVEHGWSHGAALRSPLRA